MNSGLEYTSAKLFLKGEPWLWRIMRRMLFSFNAEMTHKTAVYLLRSLSLLVKKDLAYDSIAREPLFAKNLLGLHFRNPIGLAAGFDVDAECLPALQLLGFGFIEVGGITEHAQAGNPKPRMFRLPQDAALINRLNFYNKGVHYLKRRLAMVREKEQIGVPLGVNLGKANNSSIKDVPKEYLSTFKHIHDVADYVTINVSCPNTVGLAGYQTAESLKRLLDEVALFNHSLRRPLPLFLKLGPDLTNEEAIVCAEVALSYGLSGLIISNTTQSRAGLSKAYDFGAGGLSGMPLFERSTQLLRCVAKDYQDRLTLIGSGGIMDGTKALAKLNAGADLLQVYTGFIYGGPRFVFGLLHYLKQHYVA